MRITKKGEEMGTLNFVLGVLDDKVDDVQRFV